MPRIPKRLTEELERARLLKEKAAAVRQSALQKVRLNRELRETLRLGRAELRKRLDERSEP